MPFARWAGPIRQGKSRAWAEYQSSKASLSPSNLVDSALAAFSLVGMACTIASMVNRSSLDPIEEARARIRLRYQRARPLAAPPKSVGAEIMKLARKKLPEKGPAIGRLKLQWADIVGPSLAKVCEPDKIGASPKGKGRVLTLRRIPAASTMVQHQSELIRQRVSVSLGGDVRDIRIVQGPLKQSPPAAPAKKRRTLTPSERESLLSSVQTIEDTDLRKAVLALGEAVLTTDES